MGKIVKKKFKFSAQICYFIACILYMQLEFLNFVLKYFAIKWAQIK